MWYQQMQLHLPWAWRDKMLIFDLCKMKLYLTGKQDLGIGVSVMGRMNTKVSDRRKVPIGFLMIKQPVCHSEI